MTKPASTREVEQAVEDYQKDEAAIRDAVREILVGQESALDEVLTVLLSGGHGLIEGVPGTGKTMLVNRLADATSLGFRRVQFTPDLLPADILGYDTLVSGESGDRIEFRPGPVFTQFLLADEINRGTPRTQSALLESMQEHSVTIGNKTHNLDPLFTVFATRNPIELEGTYPLPEAQLDRFQLQIDLTPATVDEMVTIADRTTANEEPQTPTAIDGARLLEMRTQTRNVLAAEPLLRYAARLVRASQPSDPESPTIVRDNVRFGAGVRALQALVLSAKVEALRSGRFHVAREDLNRYLAPVLRHRLILSLEGEARGVGVDEISAEICHVVAAASS